MYWNKSGKMKILKTLLTLITLSTPNLLLAEENNLTAQTKNFLKNRYNLDYVNTFYKTLTGDKNNLKSENTIITLKNPLRFSTNGCLTITLSLEDLKSVLNTVKDSLADEIPNYILQQTLGLPDPNNPKEVMDYLMKIVKQATCSTYATTATSIMFGINTLFPNTESKNQVKESFTKGERVNTAEKNKATTASDIEKLNLKENVSKKGEAVRQRDVASEKQESFLSLYKVNYENCMTTINDITDYIANLVINADTGNTNKVKNKINSTCKVNKTIYQTQDPIGKAISDFIGLYQSDSTQSVIVKNIPIGKILLSLNGIKIVPDVRKIAYILRTDNIINNLLIDYINNIFYKKVTDNNNVVYNTYYEKRSINFKDNVLLRYLFFNTLKALGEVENGNLPNNVVRINDLNIPNDDKKLLSNLFSFSNNEIVTGFNILENLTDFCGKLDVSLIINEGKSNQDLIKDPFINSLLQLFNQNINIFYDNYHKLSYTFEPITYNLIKDYAVSKNISIYNTLKEYRNLICNDFKNQYIQALEQLISNDYFKRNLAFNIGIIEKALERFEVLEAYFMPYVSIDNKVYTDKAFLPADGYEIVNVCTSNIAETSQAKLIVAYRKKDKPLKYYIEEFSLIKDQNGITKLDTNIKGLNNYLISYYPQTIVPFPITMYYNDPLSINVSYKYSGKKIEIPISNTIPIEVQDKMFECHFEDDYNKVKDNIKIKNLLENLYQKYNSKKSLKVIGEDGSLIAEYILTGDETKDLEMVYKYFSNQSEIDLEEKAKKALQRLRKIDKIILGQGDKKGLIDLLLKRLERELNFLSN